MYMKTILEFLDIFSFVFTVAVLFALVVIISYFNNFPHMTVKEAAYNLGFYDEYHFSRQFKKIIGISPSEFKKNNRRG